jgi:hypothetical protein
MPHRARRHRGSLDRVPGPGESSNTLAWRRLSRSCRRVSFEYLVMLTKIREWPAGPRRLRTRGRSLPNGLQRVLIPIERGQLVVAQVLLEVLDERDHVGHMRVLVN